MAQLIPSRRAMMLGGAAALAAGPALAAPAIREVASGLQFPEGPCTLSNGDVLFVEIARKTLSRLRDGEVSVVAALGGGPNGCAIGPDGAAYVANDGGLAFRRSGDRLAIVGVPDDYKGGSIQRVDLKTGETRTLFTQAGDNPLKGPNDLVFDAFGGLWFTDTGKNWPRSRDNGGLYWCDPKGGAIREMAYPLLSPNGIALGPDRRTLYVVLSPERKIAAYEIVGPGQLALENGVPRQRIVAAPPGATSFDNMAVEAGGNLIAGAIIMGALMVMSPTGEVIETVKMPEPFPTAMAFGGPDMKTLYVTLSTTGKLIALDWPRAGLTPLYRI